ncbi:MAG: histidine kinase [Christensenella sp.]
MKKKDTTVSARKYLTFYISCFLIPLSIFLIIYNIISISSFQSINTEIAETGKNTIEMYQSIMDLELDRVSLLIADSWANNYHHQSLLYKTDGVTLNYSVNEIAKEYRTMMTNSMCLRGMMLYSGENNLTRLWLQEGVYPFALSEQINAEMLDIVDNVNVCIKQGWIPREIDGRHFIFRILGYHNSYTVAMMDIDLLCGKQNKNIENKNGFLYYTMQDGAVFTKNDAITEQHIKPDKFKDEYYITKGSERYLVTSNYSTKCNLQIMYFISYNSSVPFMQKMQIALFAVSLFLVCLVPVFYKMLSKTFFKPIDKLDETMQHIRDGNIDEKIDNDYKIKEFKEINITFNEMMGEIKNLKIESYEKEISRQQAELQYLQLQIKPHFFLNCLKIIYSMVEQKKYEKIQPMVLQISQYLRYCFKDNMSLVTLAEELEYVKNYVTLQKDSMLQQVQYVVDMEAGLEKCPIPVLLVQTFIENSFKYAQKQGEVLHLTIKIIKLETEQQNFVDIVISDNGNGFSQEMLDKINCNMPASHSKDNVGIANVKHRLTLLYADDAVVQCSNTQTGAQCEIVLPMQNTINGDLT